MPAGDEEAPALAAALAGHGVEAVPAVWDDERVEWAAYDLVVVRSTWDYTGRREQFLTWAGSVPRVLNAPPVLRWNTDKRYLDAFGADAVPTRFLDLGDAFDPPDEPFVVKPSVGAGAIGAARYAPGDPASAQHVARLHDEGRTVMVQPYVAELDTRGETALIYVDGLFSHAVRKAAILRSEGPPAEGLYAPEEMSVAEPTSEELAFADRVFGRLPFPRDELLYARIDLVPGPLVLEVELTEPSLFLGYADGAAERLAAAIAKRLP